MNLRAFTAIVSLTLISASIGRAGTMLQPVGAVTNMGSFTTFEAVHAIDKSALAASYTSGVTNFDTFVPATATVNGGSSGNTWFSSSGNLTGNFDFDLGGSFNIESLAIWADPQPGGQGVNNFNLFADDNAAFSSPTLLGNYSAADGLGNPANFGQIFGFAATVATHVRMQILSNHGSALTTGIVEAAFEVVVPEPGSLGMVLLAGLMTLVRSRRS